MQTPALAPDALEQQLREACAELERRVRAGANRPTEDLLNANDALRGDSNAALELIYTEFVVREQLGHNPTPDEWFARFADRRRDLEQIFEVHRYVAASVQDTSKPWSGTTSLDSRRSSQAADATIAERRVGNYELLEEIGRGGMGVVYKARQIGLNRVVALKMVRSAEYADADEHARLAAEAEAAARLKHSHIVQIHEIGLHAGQAYFSMEFVEAGSMADCLGGTPVDARAVAQLAEVLARAVHYAHEHGIVHRDLKPANILLAPSDEPDAVALPVEADRTRRYTPKIADFGLAKFRARRDSVATTAGAMLGTPSYMAPEQTHGAGDRIGPAADIYAIGAILYELLVGRPPFKAATMLETLAQVQSQEPVPPSRLQPKLPRDLETICLKCLAKEPDKRYGSTALLAEDLRRFLAGKPVLARRTRIPERAWRWCRRNPLTATLASLLAAVAASGLAGVFCQWSRAERQAHTADVARQQAERDQTEAGRQRDRAENHLRMALDVVDRLAGIERDLAESPTTNVTRQRALEGALSFYLNLLQTDSDDLAIRRDTAHAYARAANIQDTLGQWRKANQTYREAVDFIAKLAGDQPDDPSLQPLLAKCYRRWAYVLFRLEEPQQSAACYERSVATWEQYLKRTPGDFEATVWMANTLSNYTLVFRGDATQIEQLHQRSIQLLRTALADADPSIDTERLTWFQRDLGVSLEAYGRFLHSKGRFEEAEDRLRQALDSYAHACRLDPQSADARYYHGRAHTTLAELLARRDQPESAEQLHRAGAALLQASVAEFPDRPPYREALTESYDRLAALLYAQKRLAEAEPLYTQVIALTEQLRADYPDVAQHRRRLPVLCERHAIIRQRLGNHAAAIESWKQAVDYAAALANESASQLDRDRLAELHTHYARTLRRTGQFQAANEQYQAASDLTPQSPRAQNAIAWFLAVWAEPPLRDPTRAAQLAEQATRSRPDRATYWNTLGVAYYRCQNWSGAIDALNKSIELDPHRPARIADWLFLALAHRQLGQTEPAKRWYRRAVEWMEQNPTSDPELLRFRTEADDAFQRDP